MKNSFTYLFLFIFSLSAISQNAKEIKGQKHFDSYSYEKAIDKLEQITDKSTDVNRQLANSYFKTGDLEKSEEYYSSVVNATDNMPSDLYSYASVLEMNKKYALAEEWMVKYHKLNKDDTRGIASVNNKGLYKSLEKDNGRFRIANLDINTDQSEFGTAYFKNQIVFASTRSNGASLFKRHWNWNGLGFLNLYVANNNGVNELSDVTVFNSKVDKRFHEGPASFSADGKFMVYTRNNYDDKDSMGVVRLQIFSLENIDDKWTNKTELHFNDQNHSSGHGALTPDGKTMYFASDMQGGLGGVDIYVTHLSEAKIWSKPVNMGDKINTEGDETFPFIHDSGKMLFFSSNGKVGLGGLDVFVAQVSGNNVKAVENLGTPINTNSDDFAFMLDANEKGGFFSSNRIEGKGNDDIYSFKLIKPFAFGKTLKGIAKDKEGNLLANTFVKLYDAKNNFVLDSVLTDSTANYVFIVDDKMDFLLTGEKEKYFKANNTATSKTDETIIIADVILEKDPGISLYGLVTDKASGKPLDSVHVVLIDNLTDEEFVNLYTTSTGDFRKALAGMKIGERLSYQIKLERNGYLSKVLVFNKQIEKPGVIELHAELDLNMDKISIGLDLAKIIDIQPIYFDLNKHFIRKDASVELDKIVKVMTENPHMEIELGSHTDSRGSVSSNVSLSDRRAKASATYIVKHGIDKTRITGKGYGESTPNVVDEIIHEKYSYLPIGQIMTEEYINAFKYKSKKKFKEAHQLNRRTEFIIVKM